MPPDVGQRLGDDEVGRALDGGRGALVDAQVEVDRHRRAGHDSRQRGVEAAVLQDHGVDAPDEVAQLGEGRLGLVAGRGHHGPPALGVVREPLLRRAELHGQGDETLLRPVVQVALDPAALGLGGVDRRGPAGLEARHGPLDLGVGVRAQQVAGDVAQQRGPEACRPRCGEHETGEADDGGRDRPGPGTHLEEAELGRAAGEGADVGGQREQNRRAGPEQHRGGADDETDGEEEQQVADLLPPRDALGPLGQPSQRAHHRGPLGLQRGDGVGEVEVREGGQPAPLHPCEGVRADEQEPDEGQREGEDDEQHARGDEQRDRQGERDGAERQGRPEEDEVEPGARVAPGAEQEGDHCGRQYGGAPVATMT
nr:hypothetical protein [Actinomarinicola tropica]